MFGERIDPEVVVVWHISGLSYVVRDDPCHGHQNSTLAHRIADGV